MVDELDEIDLALQQQTNAEGTVLSLTEIDSKNDDDIEDGESDESSNESPSESSDFESSNDEKREHEDDLVHESEDEIPRTRNELDDEDITEVPANIELTKDTIVSPVGTLKTVGKKHIIVEAHKSARYRVLADGAVLVLGGPREDKQVVGVLHETFGPVDKPFYVVKFKNEGETEPLRSRVGDQIYQVVSTAKYTLTEEFKSKGTDASNFHDEEVPLEEQEFSDDEVEMMAKSSKKLKRRKRPAQPQAEEQAPIMTPEQQIQHMQMQMQQMQMQLYQYQMQTQQSPVVGPSAPSAPLTPAPLSSEKLKKQLQEQLKRKRGGQ